MHLLKKKSDSPVLEWRAWGLFMLMIGMLFAEAHPDRAELYSGAEFRGAFEDPPDNPDLPNVLLIGDSISIGYTLDVRRALAGKADVYRIPTNGRDTGFGVAHLEEWLDRRHMKWDVIHFNWGLWDICYRNPAAKVHGNRDKVHGTLCTSPEQYAGNLARAAEMLKASGARLIWCTTTPVPEDEAGRFKGDEVRYNAVAARIMHAYGIEINDLHTYCQGAAMMRDDLFDGPGNVHFTPAGYSLLGRRVAEEILRRLDMQPETTAAKH